MNFKSRFKKYLMGLGVTGLIFGTISGVSAATTGTTGTSVTINAGSLSITAPTVTVAFTSVTLDGNTQTTTADLGTFTVGDATGSGAGYNVTASASQFTDDSGTPLTLPLGSLSLAAPTGIVVNGGSTSAAPAIQAGPFSIDDGLSYKILSAVTDTGMGNYDVTFPASTLTLTLDPATTYVDTVDGISNYSSTITWTIVSGP